MIEYIYIVKCPNCEDEHFHFFDEAKACAMGYISDKPIITQVEVERNDFGECTDSHDLGTVWSWEDIVEKEPVAEPSRSFTKDEIVTDYDPDSDPEFADDGSYELSDDFELKESTEANDSLATNSRGDYLTRVSAGSYAVFNRSNVWLGTISCETNDEAIERFNRNKLDEARKPIPKGMTIEELVEAMEENEDTVECAGCEELFSKEDCFHKDGIGWLCGDCEDRIVKCAWCEELYDRSECRKEVDFGWLCDRCEAAIKSRGETLTFREGSYWDFLDEDLEDTRTLTDLVKDSISHLTNDLGKDPWADDFTDDVIADIENNYDVDIPSEPEKYRDWASAIACEVSRQLNNPLDEEVKELRDFDNGYDDTIPEEIPELPEPDEVLDSHLRLCPECGKETFDLETGICVDCGFN